MTISFILSTRNDGFGGSPEIWRQNLFGTLESITRLGPSEIIVADWDPPPEVPNVREIIRNDFPNVRVIVFKHELLELLNKERVGFPKMTFYEFIAKHYCALRASGNVLVFTNADNVFLSDGWDNVIRLINNKSALIGIRRDIDAKLRPPIANHIEYVNYVIKRIYELPHRLNRGPYGDFFVLTKDTYLNYPFRLSHMNEYTDWEILDRLKTNVNIVKTDYSTVHFMHPESGGKLGRPMHGLCNLQMISKEILNIIPAYMVEQS